MLPDPIELPEQRAVFFPELVGRGPPPPAPPLASRPPALMPPPLPVAPPPVAAPDDDDLSVASSFSATSASLGIESKTARRWKARYYDANGKTHTIGRFDTQEQAARAVNAAIRRAGLGGKRRTNPVVDGQLVPKKRKATGHGPPRKSRARRRR